MLNIEGEMVDNPTKETTERVTGKKMRDNQERKSSREERGLQKWMLTNSPLQLEFHQLH